MPTSSTRGVLNWKSERKTTMSTVSVSWPATPGWYWAYGRIAGMREPALAGWRRLGIATLGSAWPWQ